MSVVFPAPLGPSKPKLMPVGTCSESSSSAFILLKWKDALFTSTANSLDSLFAIVVNNDIANCGLKSSRCAEKSSCQGKPENGRLASCIPANIKVSAAPVHLRAALQNADGNEKTDSQPDLHYPESIPGESGNNPVAVI